MNFNSTREKYQNRLTEINAEIEAKIDEFKEDYLASIEDKIAEYAEQVAQEYTKEIDAINVKIEVLNDMIGELEAKQVVEEVVDFDDVVIELDAEEEMIKEIVKPVHTQVSGRVGMPEITNPDRR